MSRRVALWFGTLAGMLASSPVVLPADDFTIRLDDRREVVVSARKAGAGQDAVALELPDGRLELIPADRIVRQQAAADPTPLTPDELHGELLEEFGRDRVVSTVDKPFVIVLIRAHREPPDPGEQKQFQGLVKKAGTFFKGRQASFLEFVKQARVATTPIRFPLVALIFESDRQFDAYTASITGQEGLSAGNIAAFYDLLSNRLVIRLRECTTFDTPLHEAVHQQVYNRGVLERLSPVPAWFNEGLATGFEGNGETLKSGPRSVSDRYGRMALRAKVVDWREVVASDRTFQGDILAAEAYGHAWGLHWLLVTKYRSEYNQLVRHYAGKKTLETDRPAQRIAEFEKIVGKSVGELQQEFYRELPKAMSRRR
jgi:hypothetical protein